MDLSVEAERLRLDLLAVSVSATLTAAGIPHALLKGPSTANWLYDPPRRYRDVDILVPLSELQRVSDVLAERGVATSDAGGVGEVAPHSMILRSTEGFEVDVHVSLPTLPIDGDRVWRALADRLAPLDLGIGVVPQLNEPARCLVLALHALNNLPAGGQAVEDLHRAWHRSSAAVWATAAELAHTLGARDLFDAGAELVRADGVPQHDPQSTRAGLYVAGAPSSAFGLERLASARLRELPGLIWREILPSRGFMYYANPGMPEGARYVIAAHLRRWWGLLHELPRAFRAWRSARHP